MKRMIELEVNYSSFSYKREFEIEESEILGLAEKLRGHFVSFKLSMEPTNSAHDDSLKIEYDPGAYAFVPEDPDKEVLEFITWVKGGTKAKCKYDQSFVDRQCGHEESYFCEEHLQTHCPVCDEKARKAHERDRYMFPKDICIEFELSRWEKESWEKMVNSITEPDLKLSVEDDPRRITLTGRNYCAFNRVINFILQEEKKDPNIIISALFIKTVDLGG